MNDSVTSTPRRRNSRVLVGITGGIAAYKSPDLVRRLIERGADVRVVMTRGAREFITPLTLQGVSGHPVYQHLLDTDAESGMGHIELARWAEVIVVAPATANFIAKTAGGVADDLLSTLILASEAELVLAPAMNQQMWQSAATRENIAALTRRGITIIGPDAGDQACGEVGAGRMVEANDIASRIMGEDLPARYHGKAFLITAGPTWEAIDPVRGITNHSSGKMGFALAEAARDFGGQVTLVAGPVHLETPQGVNRHDVVSAKQMHTRVFELVDSADVFMGVAAVADYRPKQVADQKIKKSGDDLIIEMIKNPDILAQVATHNPRPFTVGFAAETQDIKDNAQKKLANKNVDAIVANNVLGADSAFGNDSNAASLFHRHGSIELKRSDKYGLAVKILEHIHALMNDELST